MSFIKEKIEETFFGKKEAERPKPKMVTEATIFIQATVPANQPANSVLPIRLVADPVLGSQPFIQVPLNEVWVIDDIFVTSTQPVDGIIQLRKSQREIVTQTYPVNSMLVSNPSRPKIMPITYYGGEVIDGFFINLAAGGTTASTIDVRAHVVKYVY